MTPNPGSKEAITQGCNCPIMDNNHGVIPLAVIDGKEIWTWRLDCPLHGTGNWKGTDIDRG